MRKKKIHPKLCFPAPPFREIVFKHTVMQNQPFEIWQRALRSPSGDWKHPQLELDFALWKHLVAVSLQMWKFQQGISLSRRKICFGCFVAQSQHKKEKRVSSQQTASQAQCSANVAKLYGTNECVSLGWWGRGDLPLWVFLLVGPIAAPGRLDRELWHPRHLMETANRGLNVSF